MRLLIHPEAVHRRGAVPLRVESSEPVRVHAQRERARVVVEFPVAATGIDVRADNARTLAQALFDAAGALDARAATAVSRFPRGVQLSDGVARFGRCSGMVLAPLEAAGMAMAIMRERMREA